MMKAKLDGQRCVAAAAFSTAVDAATCTNQLDACTVDRGLPSSVCVRAVDGSAFWWDRVFILSCMRVRNL